MEDRLLVKINLKAKPTEKAKISFPAYAITKFFDTNRQLSFFFDKIETMQLHKRINKIRIDRPIYITALARAGTTITLNMLSNHPDVASHRYRHKLMPYLPHWFSLITSRMKMNTKPVERIHRDGIMVTQDSPNAVEEMFWQKFFDTIHKESISNVVDAKVSHPKFERFYINHIRKLLLSERRSRYLTKNNYVITRMEYLLRLFPSSKFLLLIRDPVTHIASFIKQTRLFTKLENEIPFMMDWSRIIGSREFGYNRVCINVGNTDLIHKIRKLWRNDETYVKGWAYYWSSIYDFVANLRETNEKIKKATLLIRYEDLCGTPAKIIDKILEHTELSPKEFEETKNYYTKTLHQPTYYKTDFSEKELADIAEVTSSTAAQFGY
ncbi:MAG: sulfotransferase [Candidatus Helarchaeota archaeon]|nr:sulfotransferase [Candidatus Helarchaeota archaeon]